MSDVNTLLSITVKYESGPADWSAPIILTNMDENVKISHMKNLNLYGDNNIQMSVFAVLSLKICITDKQFLHFQRQLLNPAK